MSEVTAKDLRECINSHGLCRLEHNMYEDEFMLEAQAVAELAAFDAMAAEAKFASNLRELVTEQKNEVHLHPDCEGRLTLTIVDEKTVEKANAFDKIVRLALRVETFRIEAYPDGTWNVYAPGDCGPDSFDCDGASLAEALKAVSE